MLTNERYIEFRNIFDKLPNVETLRNKLHELSEDFAESGFFTDDFGDEEDLLTTIETVR